MAPQTRRIALGIAVIVGLQAAAIGAYVLVKRGRAPSERPFAVERLSPRPAPAVTFERADGSRGELARAPGKIVLVHFWGTWCEPCRKELPALLARTAELAGDRFELLAVAVDDGWPEISTFFDGAIPSSVVRPTVADVHRRYGASTLPDTYLVAPDGTLVERIAGARDWQSSPARRYVKTIEQLGSRRR